ncbi:MAG: hypothetical protein JO142_21520 [Burkholderiales bacterium]|nr:hypothetical protein [Burkholderiales bacterium]
MSHSHLVLVNPGQAGREINWALDKAFWAQPEGGCSAVRRRRAAPNDE